MSLESKKEWIWPKEKVNTNEIIDTILKERCISDADSFLNPKLEDIPIYKDLYGAQEGAKEIVKAVKEGKKIVIHGDYDADGVCATSILWEFLYYTLSEYFNIEVDVIPYIPNRVEQGYGLTQSSINDCLDLGAQLIITVDCGIRDQELIKENIKLNELSFVVTDHHQVPSDIESNLHYPIVHQRYLDKHYSDVEICGGFVSFLLVQAIKGVVGMDDNITEDTQGLDLVAIATVTDIMELKSVNRIVLKYGMEQIKKGERLGLKKLIEISDINYEEIDSYHLGFIIGPRINASGRLDSAIDAVKLLVSKNPNLCDKLASKLNYLNFQRQNITQEVLITAKERISDDSNIICVLDNDWHEGVVGLVAGKLNEEYFKPVLVATKTEGEIKGSGRSIPGFNITTALEKCKKYLLRFGGHEQAAGFSLEEGMWSEFISKITNIADKEITKEMLKPKLVIDLELSSDGVTEDLSEKIEQLKPFGYKNSKPKIGIKNLIVQRKQIIGKAQNHMKLICNNENEKEITILLFRCDEDIEKVKEGDRLDIVGDISINIWNGISEAQIIAKEWKFGV